MSWRMRGPAGIAVVLVAGSALAVTRLGDGGRDGVSAAQRDDRIAVARPVPPRPAGSTPGVTEIMRIRLPGAGTELAITTKLVFRPQMGRPYRRGRCLDAFGARFARTRRFQPSAACVPLHRGAWAGQLAYSLSSGLDAPTRLSGFAPPGTKRLTIAGVGPTLDVPLGPHGAFFVAIAERVHTTLTVTSELADGGTSFRRLRLPPSPVPPDAAEAPDPVDDSTWAVNASTRAGGPRAGQTCAQFFRLARDGHDAGFGAPMCGDLRREPVVVDALERGPGPRTPFGGGPDVERRMVVWGLASERVEALTVVAAGDRHEVRIGPDRAFILVLDPELRREDVTVEATLAGGEVRAWRAPRRAGAARMPR